jgi:hypothetical protein
MIHEPILVTGVTGSMSAALAAGPLVPAPRASAQSESHPSDAGTFTP